MNIEMANRFTALRKQHELSQEQLAEKLGVSRQAVSKWERAEASPDIENLSSLAKLYGITIDELVNGAQEPPSAFGAAPESSAETSGVYMNSQENDDCPAHCENIGGVTVTHYDSVEKPSMDMFLLKGFPFTLMVVIAFLLTGFLLDLWYINWVLFLLIPCWYGMLDAIKKRRPDKFPYPVLVAAAYLVMGFLWDLWHPGWVVFMTIPVYYWIADAIREHNK